MAKARTLKFWNGRIFSESDGHGYIAAYTRREAVALGKLAFGRNFTTGELDKYWSKDCWGVNMEGIEPMEPGAWAQLHRWGPVWHFVKETVPSKERRKRG